MVAALAALVATLALLDHREKAVAAGLRGPSRTAPASIPLSQSGAWTDRYGDGWPDAARLDRPVDRVNFVRWLTYLAESAYYQPGSPVREEVNDCAALIRHAYRNALVAHTAAWRSRLFPWGRVEPGFGDVGKFAYPDWPLGRGLFRTRGGPFAREDLERGAFQEFADAQTMLRDNTFAVSKEIRAARAGDVLFFRQPEQSEPYHIMLFVGRSHFQSQGVDWIVYHTGSVNGASGEVRHVRASVLAQHPEPRWWPLESNPRFLGVYRFNLLR